jgi:Luciferase-like monooxygenase
VRFFPRRVPGTGSTDAIHALPARSGTLSTSTQTIGGWRQLARPADGVLLAVAVSEENPTYAHNPVADCPRSALAARPLPPGPSEDRSVTRVVRPFRFAVQAMSVGDRDAVVSAARQAEDLGYEELYSFDHLGTVDPFVPLMVAAEVTSELRVGPLVLNNELHHPALLARTAATVDDYPRAPGARGWDRLRAF